MISEFLRGNISIITHRFETILILFNTKFKLLHIFIFLKNIVMFWDEGNKCLNINKSMTIQVNQMLMKYKHFFFFITSLLVPLFISVHNSYVLPIPHK